MLFIRQTKKRTFEYLNIKMPKGNIYTKKYKKQKNQNAKKFKKIIFLEKAKK